MGRTLHEQVAEKVLDDMLAHPATAASLADVYRRIRAGQIDATYLAIFGQTHPRAGEWSMAQIAAYFYTHAHLMGGEFGQVTIEVGEYPHPDAERERNAAALADLPEPFTATVDMEQNADPDGDGWLEWSDTITIEKSTGEGIEQSDGSTSPKMMAWKVESGFTNGVPIEIGYTLPSRTMGHLFGRYWGLARWPYGSPYMTLLLNLDMFVPPGGARRNPLRL